MLKTVEIPLAGHPDKVCDQIADALLDEYLRRDPRARVDLTVLGSHGMVMIGGTVDSRADFDAAEIARATYKKIGYKDDIEPFVNIERPTEDAAKVIVKGGAAGTCVVRGYATKETRERLPRALVYAQALARRLDDLRRHDESFRWLRPDGKVQLTMDGTTVKSVVILVEHDGGVERNVLQSAIVDNVIMPILGEHVGMKMHVNQAGSFVGGGFKVKAGASGRKTDSDLYGGIIPSGSASLSGRDPLHPGRAGTYFARLAAKTLVDEGVAGNVMISVGYALGLSDPIFIEALTGEGKDISDLVRSRFDFRPEAIVERLNLRTPIYEATSVYGQFGRSGVAWEETK